MFLLLCGTRVRGWAMEVYFFVSRLSFSRRLLSPHLEVAASGSRSCTLLPSVFFCAGARLEFQLRPTGFGLWRVPLSAN